jgi:hypothetical protein
MTVAAVSALEAQPNSLSLRERAGVRVREKQGERLRV